MYVSTGNVWYFLLRYMYFSICLLSVSYYHIVLTIDENQSPLTCSSPRAKGLQISRENSLNHFAIVPNL